MLKKRRESMYTDEYMYMHSRIHIACVTFSGLGKALKYFDISEEAFFDWKDWAYANNLDITSDPEVQLRMFFDGYMSAFEQQAMSMEIVDVSVRGYSAQSC